MGGVEAVEGFVPEEGRHRGVVDLLKLPFAGGGEGDPGLGEGPDDVVRQIGADAFARSEGAGDLLGQLRHPAWFESARIALAQQAVEHLTVHIRPPGHPGPGHLGGDQHARRFGGDQQPHPLGMCRPGRTGQLAGVDLQQGRQLVRTGRQGHRARLEEGRLGLGGPRGCVVGHRQAVQPGPGGGQRAGLPALALLVADQQRLGGLDVVTALDPHSGRQQAAVELGGGAPHPPVDFGARADRLGERGLLQHPAGGPAVGGERAETSTPVARLCHCPSHVPESGTRV